MRIAPERRVAVIGPSGAGKSTLLALVAGFLAPEAGRLLWQGVDITQEPPGARPVAMIFQEGNLFPHLSVYENVALGVNPALKLGAGEKARVMRALERVSLGGMEARKPAQLSGGQQSRAALARALVQDRPILALDEPFAALGPALKVEMLDLVREIADERRATVLMVSHDPQDARRFAEEVIVVAEGHAAPPRETAEIFADPPEALRDYLGG
ncbi:ATP-binding cassette domain-containing protein [Rhodobacteraceae bacterium 63075]|nr:ATP-binding cassette domain-containing protein [Rhodobacteraceae bacterium 63075]